MSSPLVGYIIACGEQVITLCCKAEHYLVHLKSYNLGLDITAESDPQVTKAWKIFGHTNVPMNKEGI